MATCLMMLGALATSQPAADLPLLSGIDRQIAVAGEGYFPVLARLEDGRLAAVVRGGAGHLGKGGRLDWIESLDGGTSWTSPRTVVDSEWDDRNPAFGQLADGSLCLAYAVCSCYDEQGNWAPALGDFAFRVTRSSDGGWSWAESVPLETPFPKGGSPYGRIVTTAEGVALMSVYGAISEANAALFPGESPATDACGLLVSRDNGATWGEFRPIARGYNETALLPIGRRSLLAFARSDGDQHVALLRSDDLGRTWSAPVAITLGSQHPADAALLASGEVLVVYGNRLAPFGVHALRCALEDDFATAPRLALAKDSANGDQGYPSVVVGSDGTAVALWYAVGASEGTGGIHASCARFDPDALPRAMAPIEPTPVVALPPRASGVGPLPSAPAAERRHGSSRGDYPWTTRRSLRTLRAQ